MILNLLILPVIKTNNPFKMLFMKKTVYLIIPLMILIFSACGSSEFKRTDSGLTYKVHKSNRGSKAVIDNIVKIDIAYRYPADSVFFANREFGEAMYIPVIPSEYSGDIYEGFRMMAKGDSVTFKLDALNFFTTTQRMPMIPDFIPMDDSVYVDVLILDIFTQDEYQAYRQKKREDMFKQQEEARHDEDGLRQRYLDENNITVQPEESGLVIVVKEEGSGPRPQSGQNVKVHYTGTLLDGTKFDSSVDKGEPFTFRLGAGQVIRGWDEGVSKLNIGSKAKLIIPSYLAYGDQQRGPVIKPYSTLIFDIEVIDAN
jgi:FKBP-type peptidyl-prolyl cis-trans isomerase FkpA